MSRGRDGREKGLEMKKQYRFALFAGAAVVLVVSALLIPLRIPYSVHTHAKIVPARKWVLEKGTNGQLLVSSFNYETGLHDEYSMAQSERGETMQFVFRSAVLSRGMVRGGDTIGTIVSSETRLRLAELEGRVATAKATLAASYTGEKESVVREAEQRIGHAEKAAAEQRTILERYRKLRAQDLVSQEQYELAETSSRLLDMEVEIARSQLETVSTGEKPEQIRLLNTQISALENELIPLRNLLNSFTVVVPFSGAISKLQSPDTLLVLSDTARYVALLPVSLASSSYVSTGLPVRVQPINRAEKIHGTLESIDRDVQLWEGEQVLVGRTVLDGSDGVLLPGMIARCEIECGSIEIPEYIRRLLNTSAF